MKHPLNNDIVVEWVSFHFLKVWKHKRKPLMAKSIGGAYGSNSNLISTIVPIETAWIVTTKKDFIFFKRFFNSSFNRCNFQLLFFLLLKTQCKAFLVPAEMELLPLYFFNTGFLGNPFTFKNPALMVVVCLSSILYIAYIVFQQQYIAFIVYYGVERTILLDYKYFQNREQGLYSVSLLNLVFPWVDNKKDTTKQRCEILLGKKYFRY